jgi:hypothetical protein
VSRWLPCPTCEKRVRAGWNYCPICGLREPWSAAAAQRQAPASTPNGGGRNAREHSETLASESTAIEVACPVCDSPPGEPCVEPGSRLLVESPREAFHVGRCAAFFAGGVAAMPDGRRVCDACGLEGNPPGPLRLVVYGLGMPLDLPVVLCERCEDRAEWVPVDEPSARSGEP